jgi:hypothetical protein
MDRELAIKLVRALVDAGFIADDQRADAAMEGVALEAGLSREQLKTASAAESARGRRQESGRC